MLERNNDSRSSAKSLSLIFAIPLSAVLVLRVLWSGVVYPESNIVVLLILVTLFSAYLLCSALAKGVRQRFSGIDTFFVFYFGLMLILYLLSKQRWLARDFFIQVCACTIAYFFSRFVGSSRNGATAVLVGLVSGVMIVSVYGLYQYFWGFAETRALYAQRIGQVAEGTPLYSRLFSQAVFSTFFFPNALAGYMIIVIPLLVALFFIERRRLFIISVLSYLSISLSAAIASCYFADISRKPHMLNWLHLTVAGLILASAVSIRSAKKLWQNIFSLPLLIVPIWVLSLTASEASWLSLFFAAVVFCPLLNGRRKTGIAIVLVLLILMAVALIGDWVPSGLKSSMEVRYGYWQAALNIWREKPLWGMGQGSFPYAYTRFRSPASEEGRMAHSIYLHLAAEMGVVGLFAFLFLWTAFLLSALTGARRGEPLCFAVFVSVGAFLLHGAVGVGITVPAAVFTLWALAGLCAGSVQTPAVGLKFPRPVSVIAAVSLLAVALFWLVPNLDAVYHKEKAVELSGRGRMREARKALSRAISIEPGNPLYWATRGDILRREGESAQVLEAYRRAAELSGGLAPYQFRLAVQNWQMGDKASAIHALEEAIRCNPHDADYHLLLGGWLEKTSKKGEALTEYRRGLELIEIALENPGRIRRHSRVDYGKLKAMVEDKIGELERATGVRGEEG